MPRSGSTLLQNIIAQNPDFYVTPTSGLIELVSGARINYSNAAEFKAQDAVQMKKAFLSFARSGMQGYFRALTDRPYVLDKSRGWGVHFDLLDLIFKEEPRIICMVRDLRQILASMERKFRQNPDKHRPIENHNNLTGTTTFKRTVLHLQTTPVGQSLDRLAEIHQRGWHNKILFIRYEDLTASPQLVLKKIYAYLGVPEFEHKFDHVAQATHEDDHAYGTLGLHQIRPKVELLSHDYLSVLGKDAVKYVQQNFAWYFTTFGYQLKSV